MMTSPQTIFALSSGVGRAGVAVIRLSGPQSRFALDTLAPPVPPPRQAALRSIRDWGGSLIDRGLVLWFPGPDSFTGEDCAELQVHGSAAVISDMLKTLAELPGCVPAQAGAFARRAFENGKLDLTAVEGLADLIDAETTAQRRAALRQADGALQHVYDDWRLRLMKAMGLVEAAIDFSDEGDVAEQVMAEARPLLDGLREDIAAHLVQSQRARGLRDGLTLCIAGPPNAGKSSLMNWLAQRDIAIVDSTAGTTRDRLETRIDLAGVPVTVIDTAGLRDVPASSVEAAGIVRAEDAMRRADIVLWLDSPDTVWAGEDPGPDIDSDAEWIRARNKADLMTGDAIELPDSVEFLISVQREHGLDSLMDRIQSAVTKRAGLTESAVASRVRHKILLDEVGTTLLRALAADEGSVELVAEHLRQAADRLGRLTGRIDVEDVLGAIFSEFCIGK
jgi:tRNA modification GTPase